jgi:hypothetical protein
MAKKIKKNGNGSAPEVEFTYEKDTKRTHRFKVGDYGEAVSGTIYLPKEAKIPDKIILIRADD